MLFHNIFGQTVESACIYLECSYGLMLPPAVLPPSLHGEVFWLRAPPYPSPNVSCCEIAERITHYYVLEVNSFYGKNTQFSKWLLVKLDTRTPYCLWCGHFPAPHRLGETNLPFSSIAAIFELGNVQILDDRHVRKKVGWQSAAQCRSVFPPSRSTLTPDPPREVWRVRWTPGERSHACMIWVKVMVLSRSLNFLLTRCITLPPTILDYPSCLSVCVCVSSIIKDNVAWPM